MLLLGRKSPHYRSCAVLTAYSIALDCTSRPQGKLYMTCVSRREERKAQLRAAAQDMKQSGKAEAAFEESQYSVGDDKSPNIHTRVSRGLWLGLMRCMSLTVNMGC